MIRRRRIGRLAARCLALSLPAAADERPSPPPVVIPTPKKLTMVKWSFALDDLVYILVSVRATRGTRRAARIVQLGLRERFGLDPRIVRIVRRPKQPPGAKGIWVVEPRLGRPPARTIGEKGLRFSEPMLHEGYFIRVDAMEIVLHGATDAGSCNAAQTLLQMIRPARRGTLFRKAQPLSIPCCWVADWPHRPARSLPQGCAVPKEPEAMARFVRALGRYKINAVPKSALPAHPAALEQFHDLATRYAIRVVVGGQGLPQTPLGAIARRWLKEGDAAAYGIAALGEQGWAGGAPDAGAFRLRFARGVFRSEAAAEAMALTEEYLAAPAPRAAEKLRALAKAVADATGEEAARFAAERQAHERRAARIRKLWKEVEARPGLCAAFLEVAEREIAAWDDLYALAARLAAAARAQQPPSLEEPRKER